MKISGDSAKGLWNHIYKHHRPELEHGWNWTWADIQIGPVCLHIHPVDLGRDLLHPNTIIEIIMEGLS